MQLTPKQLDAIREHYHLSERETRLVELLFRGVHSAQGLAGEMGLSPNTVKVYMRNVFAKVGPRTKVALIVKLTELLIRQAAP